MSIYDVLNGLIAEVDREIERLVEMAFDAAREVDAFVHFADARHLHGIILDMSAAYDEGIDAVFAAVHELDCYITCPF